MQICSALRLGLCFLDRDSVLVGVSILANAGYLPRDFHPRCAAGDLEAVVRNLFSYVERRRWNADGSEKITKIFVERAEPLGKLNRGFSVGIELRDAVVYVHHVGRFDERVVEVLV